MLSCIEISKDNLRSNINQFREKIPQGSKLVAVVKANAYGHGLKEIVEISKEYVDAFQVDDIEELIELRKHTNKKAYVFGYVEKNDLYKIIELDGVLGVYNIETIEMLNAEAEKRNSLVTVHLKIDAFLGRQGVLTQDVKAFLEKVSECKYIRLEAIYSHFSNIEDSENFEHAKKQFDELMNAKQVCAEFGFKSIEHHISATSGFLIDQSANWGGAIIRLGIGMYGHWPSQSLCSKYEQNINLKPVLSWISKIAQKKSVSKGFPIGYGLTFITQRDTTIAIVPQGYSDGYDRGFSNNSFVLVRGKRCSVVGRIAMNMFAIDVTGVDVELEDEVVLIGLQHGESITAEELAERIDTINYEILARISPLLQRVIK